MIKELSSAEDGMDGLRPAPSELEDVVKELISQDFPHLLAKRFVLAVRDVALQTPEGQSIVAAVGISTNPDDSFDYIFWFAWDVWQLLTSNQREAIVFHELMHCDSSKADSTGLRPHDANVFDEEVKRYGVWWEQPAALYAGENVNWNSVNWNSEDFQRQVIEAVNWNSVNWNSVNWNSEVFQKMVVAFVNWNSVNWNSVNWNSVNWNSEDFRRKVIAAVNWNSVNWNSVNWNSETFQEMIKAAVNWNSVNWNSVNWNSVNWNSVNWNSVNWNSVNWNSVNWNSFDIEKFSNKEKLLEKTAIKREHGIDFPPRDYAYVPDPLRPATWKLRLTETPGQVSVMQLQRAAAALSPTGFRGNRLELPAATVASVKRRLRAEFRRLKVSEEKIPVSVKEVSEEPFLVWKDAKTGLMRWFAIYSNNFRDQDNPSEIISEQSQQTYVDLVDKGIVDYPELWLWHTKGTAWGKADWVAYLHGFAMASGLVYPGYEYIAKNLKRRGNLRVSHGMIKPLLVYDPKDKSVILFHVTAEISPLPDWAAANALTGFTILDEGDFTMPLPDAKKAFLKEAGLTDGVLDQLDENLAKSQKFATESGLESKDASIEDNDSDITEFDTGELELDAARDEGDEEAEEVVAVKETAKAAPATAKTKRKKVDDVEMAGEESVPAKKPMKKKEAEPEFVTRQEVAEALGVVLTPLMQTITNLTAQVETLTKGVTALQADDEEKIAATKEMTPTLSLADLISHNIVGKETSRVKGNTTLGKDGPKETAIPTIAPPTMVPFLNELMAGNTAAQ